MAPGTDDWGGESSKKRDRKLGSASQVSWLEKPQHSGSFDYIQFSIQIEQRGRVICIRLNKEVRLLHTDKQGGRRQSLCSWIKGAGLVNLSRNNLCKEAVFKQHPGRGGGGSYGRPAQPLLTVGVH